MQNKDFATTNDELLILVTDILALLREMLSSELMVELVSLLREILHSDEELRCYRVSDVAELTTHSSSQIRKLITQKKIKSFHSGTSLLIRKKRLLEYIEGLEKLEEEN